MVIYRNRHIVWVLLCGILAFAGCLQTDTQPNKRPFARVGDKTLSLKQARAALPEYRLQKDSIQALFDYRSQWIKKQLMLQEALRLNLDKQRHVQEKITRLKENLYVNALEQYVLSNREKQTQTTREEARDYYQQHKDKFTLKERYVRFRHMSTEDNQSAQKARSELLGGVEWNEVVRKYHVNPQKALRESKQFVPISMAVPGLKPMKQFLEVIGNKEISPIQYVSGNYHFVQLMDERPEGHNPDLQWMLDNLEDWLKVKKKKDELNAYVKNLYLRAEANNEIETYNVFDSDTISNRPFNDTTQSPIHE